MNYTNEVFEAISDVDIFTEDNNSSSNNYLEYIVDKVNKLHGENGFKSEVRDDYIVVSFNNVDLFDLQQYISWFLDYAREAEERIDDIGNFTGDFTISSNSPIDNCLVIIPKTF